MVGLLKTQGYPELRCEFKASLSYVAKPCVKKQEKGLGRWLSGQSAYYTNLKTGIQTMEPT